MWRTGFHDVKIWRNNLAQTAHKCQKEHEQLAETCEILGVLFNDPVKVNWNSLDPRTPGFRRVRGAAIPTVSRGGHAGFAVFSVLHSVNDSQAQASPQSLLICDFLERTLYWILRFSAPLCQFSKIWITNATNRNQSLATLHL